MKNKLILWGLAGEYAVCAELCRLGYLPLPTQKNNPVFDVVAMNPVTFESVAIQVKTKSPGNQVGWKLGKLDKPDKTLRKLFVVLVSLDKAGSHEFFVWKYADLYNRVEGRFASYMKISKKDGTPRRDPGFRWYDFRDFEAGDTHQQDAWHLLGI